MVSAVRRQIIGSGDSPINKSRRRRPQIVGGGGAAGPRLYLGVTINEDMLESAQVENLVSVCSRSLFAPRVLRAHDLPSEAMLSVTRATTIARLMYAVPSWWGHHCRKRQGQNRTVIQSVKANGVPSVDAHGIPALVDQAEASLFQSIHQNPAHVLRHLLPPTVQHEYGLRPRPHNYVVPPRTAKT